MRVTLVRKMARRAGVGMALAALTVLGGCVVAPPAYEVGSPVAYPDGTYGTYYDYGGTYYNGYPYVYGPAVSLGIFGGWDRGPRWRGEPPRHGFQSGPGPRPGGMRPGPGPRPAAGGSGPGPRPGNARPRPSGPGAQGAPRPGGAARGLPGGDNMP